MLDGEDSDAGEHSGRRSTRSAYRQQDNQLIIEELPGQFHLPSSTTFTRRKTPRWKGCTCPACAVHAMRSRRLPPHYLLSGSPGCAGALTTRIVVADKGALSVPAVERQPHRPYELADGRHWVQWRDRFETLLPVRAGGGDFDVLRDSFTTRSGRRLRWSCSSIAAALDRADWAMTAEEFDEVGRDPLHRNTISTFI